MQVYIQTKLFGICELVLKRSLSLKLSLKHDSIAASWCVCLCVYVLGSKHAETLIAIHPEVSSGAAALLQNVHMRFTHYYYYNYANPIRPGGSYG